ncbi:MAG: nucleoid-associated protein [Dysgonomonas sp.]|nr:nucleoid-associated protein [Dysgonomonas sp.]
MKLKIGNIAKMIVHMVGNKEREEGVSFSEVELDFKIAENNFKDMISKSFKLDDFCEFYFESTLELNPIYTFVRTIFKEPKRFIEQSNFIAKILYEKSTHPKIKAGELSIMYLTDCMIDDKSVNGIVLFKSENKQTVMRYNRTDDGYSVEKSDVISLSKIEKGCLILDVEEESGYRVIIVDKATKGQEAKYWKDEFLHVRYCQSARHQTNTLINFCRSFIKEKCEQTEKLDKAFSIARAKKILSETEEVTLQEFANEVFEDELKAKEFISSVTTQQVDIPLDSSIPIETRMAKRKSSFPSITLHLDSNFDINVYGGKEFLVHGFDEAAGMYYYTCYYNKEK